MGKKHQHKFTGPLQHVKLHRLDWLEWLTIIFGGWFLFFPTPYEFLFTVLLIIPILGLILNGLSRPSLASLISVSKEDGKDDYDVADFIEIPGLIIFIRVLIDFEFESFYSIIKVGTLGFILLLILLGATHRLVEQTNKNKWVIYLSVVGNIALYSYAATYGVNCVYDNSEPQVYETTVIDKSISRGRRHTSYYLKVKPWGHHKESEKISVPLDQYRETEIGQTVSVDYKKGLLGIPWYYIER